MLKLESVKTDLTYIKTNFFVSVKSSHLIYLYLMQQKMLMKLF
jgi:hypothetical protein